MAEFLDYDPLTGLRYDWEWDAEKGEATIRTSQDVTPLLEYNRALANDSLRDGGIKKGWWQYCSIPPIVEIQLRAKGINIHDKNCTKRLLEEINTNYPHLKVTQKNEGGKVAQWYDFGRKS